MKLQTKTILCFDAAIISVCILLSLLGYRAANNGFEAALEEKAHSDLHQAKTLLELYYPGPWYLKNGLLFKGEKQMDGAFDVVDHLSRMNGNNVTIFNRDTRVATTFPRENAASPEKPTGGHPVSGSIERAPNWQASTQSPQPRQPKEQPVSPLYSAALTLQEGKPSYSLVFGRALQVPLQRITAT